jgi:hypothetical protein
MNKTHETPRAKTKRQNAEWRKALAEGRVLKFNNGLQFTAYPTVEYRERAYGEAINAGFNVERVKV